MSCRKRKTGLLSPKYHIQPSTSNCTDSTFKCSALLGSSKLNETQIQKGKDDNNLSKQTNSVRNEDVAIPTEKETKTEGPGYTSDEQKSDQRQSNSLLSKEPAISADEIQTDSSRNRMSFTEQNFTKKNTFQGSVEFSTSGAQNSYVNMSSVPTEAIPNGKKLLPIPAELETTSTTESSTEPLLKNETHTRNPTEISNLEVASLGLPHSDLFVNEKNDSGIMNESLSSQGTSMTSSTPIPFTHNTFFPLFVTLKNGTETSIATDPVHRSDEFSPREEQNKNDKVSYFPTEAMHNAKKLVPIPAELETTPTKESSTEPSLKNAAHSLNPTERSNLNTTSLSVPHPDTIKEINDSRIIKESLSSQGIPIASSTSMTPTHNMFYP